MSHRARCSSPRSHRKVLPPLNVAAVLARDVADDRTTLLADGSPDQQRLPWQAKQWSLGGSVAGCETRYHGDEGGSAAGYGSRAVVMAVPLMKVPPGKPRSWT